jgi:hypothetical protein
MAETASFRARSTWSAAAKRTFREVSAAHPTLEKSKLSILYAACDLLSEADSMQRRIDDDGLMATGSQGQPVANPLIAEVRQYRRAALDALRALGLEGKGAASAAGAALAGKRWASRPAKAAATPAPF